MLEERGSNTFAVMSSNDEKIGVVLFGDVSDDLRRVSGLNGDCRVYARAQCQLIDVCLRSLLNLTLKLITHGPYFGGNGEG